MNGPDTGKRAVGSQPAAEPHLAIKRGMTLDQCVDYSAMWNNVHSNIAVPLWITGAVLDDKLARSVHHRGGRHMVQIDGHAPPSPPPKLLPPVLYLITKSALRVYFIMSVLLGGAGNLYFS